MSDESSEIQSIVIPTINVPLVDRYLKMNPAWYAAFVRILPVILGIAEGRLIFDGAIETRTLAAGAVTADVINAAVFSAIYAQVDTIVAGEIAALEITADMINAANIDVLSGLFGALQTNTGSTRIEIRSSTNELRCYIGGTLVASIGAEVISQGAFVKCTSPSAAWYPADLRNTSTTGGDLSTGGGSLFARSVGGYCIQSETTSTAAAIGIVGRNSGSGGGTGHIGRSNALGGHAVYASAGSYGPFTGAHDALIRKTDVIEPGDIVVDVDVVGRQLSDCMTTVVRSSEANQRGAWGVFTRRYPLPDQFVPPSMVDQDWYGWGLTHDMAVVNGVGEGCMNVCGLGGDIAKGDLIVTSAMPGRGMRQGDDVVRSHTIATAREAATFSHETAVKQIAVFYLRG